MDTDTLVKERIDDFGKLVKQLSQDGFEVMAAFWIKTTHDGRWRFYIVSPLVDTLGLTQAYGRLFPLIRKMSPLLSIDPLEVRLIGPTEPLARDVLDAHKRVPGPREYPIRWRGTWLGGRGIEDAYFYPLPTVAYS